MKRYTWRKPNSADRLELVDEVTKHSIAEIVSVGRSWQWRRNTSPLLHGAPPAEGTATKLAEAKLRVLEGLPD